MGRCGDLTLFRLTSLVGSAEANLSEALDEFAPDTGREKMLEWYETFARDLLMLAVGELLIEGRPQRFFHALSRCAENGRRILRLMQLRALDLPPASSNVPLLAAVAAKDWERATAIVACSRQSRAKIDGEYQEEYLWAAVLGRLIAPPNTGNANLPEIFDVITSLDDDGFGKRIAVARTLADRDAAGFAQVFSSERGRRERETEAIAARFGTSARDFGPHRFLWLEGLALLRLAERLALPWPDEEMRLCPPLALVAPSFSYAGDGAVRTGDWAV